MNVYLHSLGCRVNQSEVETMAREFTAAGHTIVADPTQADLCILNTCAVTAGAERKSRRRLKALARANPQAPIAAVGCYATLKPKECAALPGVTWVVPNAEKERINDQLTMTNDQSTMTNDQSTMTNDQSTMTNDHPTTHRTRAFLQVQDGCENRCTYCIVRLLRGPGRSVPLENVVAQVQALVEAGFQEVVLTGINLGAYGRDLGMANGLYRLVETLLARTAIPRLRLSSLEPWDLNRDFFSLWQDPRLCRQLHLPLQSGCDDTLRRMGRRITTAGFARLVEEARAAIPDLAVTSDIIVGFPGEEEDDFRASYDFVAALEMARLHVFPYSRRPGTPAAQMDNQVARQAREERAAAMRGLSAAQSRRFRSRFVGREMQVLWEQRRANGDWMGLTDNYLRVSTHVDDDLHNRLTSTRLLAVQDGHLTGEVIE